MDEHRKWRMNMDEYRKWKMNMSIPRGVGEGGRRGD